MLVTSISLAIEGIVGAANVRRDAASLLAYGTDALKQGHPADLVVLPGSAAEIAAIADLCHQMRVPLVVRGAGTGSSGGAVPTLGGIVLSTERLNRILEIDCDNLLAQGYVPLASRDGNVMVVPAFRSFRGGLSVQF